MKVELDEGRSLELKFRYASENVTAVDAVYRWCNEEYSLPVSACVSCHSTDQFSRFAGRKNVLARLLLQKLNVLTKQDRKVVWDAVLKTWRMPGKGGRAYWKRRAMAAEQICHRVWLPALGGDCIQVSGGTG
jgi:hypothetical protein